MPYTSALNGVTCSCGETPYWWWEDETEDTVEVYVTCSDGCGREFAKRFVNKANDTSDAALADVARTIVTSAGPTRRF